MDKRISIDEAVNKIDSGSMLALGGMTLYRRPMAFVRRLLQRFLQTGEPSNLTLLSFTGGLESDLLVGAGMVSRIRSCYFGLEIFGLAPMFTYFANRGVIEIIEETEASLAYGLRAQMAGIGFMPAKVWHGTDLPTLRPDIKQVTDPYNGEELIAFPAIRPDVAVIHALKADVEGNALIGNNKGVDEELALTAKVTLLTSEEIIPILDKADIVSPLIHGVSLAPKGAAPTSCHPLYPMDGEAILSYTEKVNDPESLKRYLDKILQINLVSN